MKYSRQLQSDAWMNFSCELFAFKDGREFKEFGKRRLEFTLDRAGNVQLVVHSFDEKSRICCYFQPNVKPIKNGCKRVELVDIIMPGDSTPSKLVIIVPNAEDVDELVKRGFCIG